MNTANDLMGLGTSPLLAQRTSNGGSGPLTIATITAGSSSSANAITNGDRIKCAQYFVSITGGNTGTNGLALPGVGGDNGALLADDFVVNNATTANLVIFGSTGVLISATGSNTSYTNMGSHTSMTLYPVSSTQWIGVKGS